MDSLSTCLHHIVIPIDACAAYANYAGNCERQWADKLTIEWRKQQFLSIWGFVRVELARYLDVQPEVLVFNRSSYGKPYIENADIPLAFNISHTKDHVALCYGKDIAACGIDIEILREMKDMLAIAQRFYAPEEFEFLNALESAEQQQKYFFKLWVIKEALLKTIGKGLSFGLDKVFVEGFSDQEQGEVLLLCDGKQQKLVWQFFEEPAASYFKAVAAMVSYTDPGSPWLSA